MIDPSRAFKPVLQPQKRTKILVNSGTNTNSEATGPDAIVVEDKSGGSSPTPEEPQPRVNVRMRRVTLNDKTLEVVDEKERIEGL